MEKVEKIQMPVVKVVALLPEAAACFWILGSKGPIENNQGSCDSQARTAQTFKSVKLLYDW